MIFNKEVIFEGVHKGFRAVKTAVKVVGPIIVMGILATNENTKPRYNNPTYCTNAKYGDAVAAITSSDMFSSHKRQIISGLPKDESDQFYIGVIEVVKSDMFSSHKVNTILDMIK